jgi:peptide/nickel transport system substrate-binding protein
MVVRNTPERIKICELLAQNLRLAGVACNVKPLESATLQDKMFNKQFDAAFGGWGTGADPDTSDNIWGTGQQRNFVSYSNSMVDELFAEGRKLQPDRTLWKELKLWQDLDTRRYLMLDEELAEARPTREDCYAAIHALLWRDQPYTWLFYRNAFEGFSKRLRGYNFSPRGITGYGPGFSSLWMPSD